MTRGAKLTFAAQLTALLAVAVPATSCAGDQAAGVIPLGLELTESETTLIMNTSCVAEEEPDASIALLGAAVTETAGDIRIDGLRGTPVEGACYSSFRIELEQPFKDRAVIVDGLQWVPLREGCPYGEIGPQQPHGRDAIDDCHPNT